MMELKKVIQWLLDQKYALIVNNQLTITSKLQHDLFGGAEVINTMSLSQPIMPTTIVVPTTRVTSSDEKKTIWNQFVERANIPHRVRAADGGLYTVRQYNLAAVNKLIQVIRSGVDYERLVQSTKDYYETVTYKVLLSNYLLRDIWKDEYNNYKPGNTTTNDGSSRWEE